MKLVFPPPSQLARLGLLAGAVLVGVFAIFVDFPSHDFTYAQENWVRVLLIYIAFIPYVVISANASSRSQNEGGDISRWKLLTKLDRVAIAIFVVLTLTVAIHPLQKAYNDRALYKAAEEKRKSDLERNALLSRFNNYASASCDSVIGRNGRYSGYLHRDDVIGYYNTWSGSSNSSAIIIENINLEQFICANKFYAHDGETAWFQGVPFNADVRTLTKANGSGVPEDDWALYAKDDNHVYKRGVVIPNIDPATFVYINSDYYKDKHTVYYKGKPVTNADPATFTSVEGTWRDYFKDADRVYFAGKEIPNLPSDKMTRDGIQDAIVYDNYSTSSPMFLYGNQLLWRYGVVTIEDPATFEYVASDIYKDQYRFYAGPIGSYRFRRQSDACNSAYARWECSSSLPAISELSQDARFIFYTGQTYPERKTIAYIVDREKVYGLVSPQGPGDAFFTLIEKADAETFRLHAISRYTQDKNSLYWEATRLEKSDPLAYTYLVRPGLLANGQNVYWYGHLLEGINAYTMQVEDGGRGVIVIRDEGSAWVWGRKCYGYGWFHKIELADIPEYLANYDSC